MAIHSLKTYLEFFSVTAEDHPFTSDYVKGCAHALARDLPKEVPLSQALEIVSKRFGFASWNAAKGSLPDEKAAPFGPLWDDWHCRTVLKGNFFAVLSEVANLDRTKKIVVLGNPDRSLLPVSAISVERFLRGSSESLERQLYLAMRADPHLIAVPDGTVARENEWDILRSASLSGHALLIGMDRPDRLPRFLRAGTSHHGAVHIPLI